MGGGLMMTSVLLAFQAWESLLSDPAMYNILNNQKDPEREEGNFSWHWVAKWIWPQNNLLLSAGFFPSTFFFCCCGWWSITKSPLMASGFQKKYPGRRRRRRRRKRVGKNHQCRGKLALSHLHIFPYIPRRWAFRSGLQIPEFPSEI